MDTLAFGYILPTTRRIRDLHPLETCAAGRTQKKDDASPKRIILFSVLFFSLFIGFFPNLGKYCQRTVCQQAHQKKALIWIHYVDLTHFAAGQDLLDLLQEMAVSRIRIILCHLLRDYKKLQRDQIKPLHRKFMVQDIVDPLAAAFYF